MTIFPSTTVLPFTIHPSLQNAALNMRDSEFLTLTEEIRDCFLSGEPSKLPQLLSGLRIEDSDEVVGQVLFGRLIFFGETFAASSYWKNQLSNERLWKAGLLEAFNFSYDALQQDENRWHQTHIEIQGISTSQDAEKFLQQLRHSCSLCHLDLDDREMAPLTLLEIAEQATQNFSLPMGTHLTQGELSDFSVNRMGGAKLVSAATHLATCAGCRDAFISGDNLRKQIRSDQEIDALMARVAERFLKETQNN